MQCPRQRALLLLNFDRRHPHNVITPETFVSRLPLLIGFDFSGRGKIVCRIHITIGSAGVETWSTERVQQSRCCSYGGNLRPSHPWAPVGGVRREAPGLVSDVVTASVTHRRLGPRLGRRPVPPPHEDEVRKSTAGSA